MQPIVTVDEAGLYCERGGFHIDPRRAVPLALITHAHADHAQAGSGQYICTEASRPLLAQRLSATAQIRGVEYGEPLALADAVVSFHPAGHILGSAQIRIESDGEVWGVSGDYKRQADPTCAPFEVVRCDTFITEATYALPIFRWDASASVAGEIAEWWEASRAAGRAAVLLCCALGKAQRILAELAELTDRGVFVHGALVPMIDIYRQAGVRMLATEPVAETEKGRAFAGELILAPPSARGTRWMRRFGDHEVGFASGAMRVRGTRRRRSFDRGFVLSDHADWPSLLHTIAETGARRVIATHGYTDVLARQLRERGIDADAWQTGFDGEPE